MKQRTLPFYIPYFMIGLVFLINIQAGITFYFHPEKFAYAYELSGIPGLTATAGTGLLFLMWNVPYAFALANPYKHRVSLIQANIMQAMGLVGESILLTRIPENQHLLLKQSIWRFIIFDGAGLVLLLIALILVLNKKAQA